MRDLFRLIGWAVVDLFAVALQPSAIVGHSTPVVVALKRETKTIPIVFISIAGSRYRRSTCRTIAS
jgi:hypothetical protein